jgi:hypothetical protein
VCVPVVHESQCDHVVCKGLHPVLPAHLLKHQERNGLQMVGPHTANSIDEGSGPKWCLRRLIMHYSPLPVCMCCSRQLSLCLYTRSLTPHHTTWSLSLLVFLFEARHDSQQHVHHHITPHILTWLQLCYVLLL